ncbi:TPA: hypothetical protein DEP58_01040 [Patescibacteria group bacterium]|nr:hypothetical protein [Patescibacteria group bacterium]
MVVIRQIKPKGEQMAKELTRETNIPIAKLIVMAIHGGIPGNSFTNCRAMNELGIAFLSTDNPEEREVIEKTFVDVLQNPRFDDCMQFVALSFLKRTDAIVTDHTKDIIAEFEENPANVNVVTAVKERLAHF